jgi:protein-tyrosine-phosphatase
MAEAILRHLSGGRVGAYSAGSEPTSIHPYAIRALADLGIDTGQQQAKHLDAFRGQAFDYIVTVCDRVREVCPVFPDDPERIHWSVPDPTAVEDDAEIEYRVFTRTAQELVTRIRYLLTLINRDKGKAV